MAVKRSGGQALGLAGGDHRVGVGGVADDGDARVVGGDCGR